MQLKYIFLTFILSFACQVQAYECKAKAFKFKQKDRAEIYKHLSKFERQQIVEGALFELSSQKFSKDTIFRGEILLSYLEQTEANQDQRAFFKLLKSASEIENEKAHSLKLNEICELMNKVNLIKER